MRRRAITSSYSFLLFVLLSFFRIGALADGQTDSQAKTSRGIVLNIVPSQLNYKVHALALRRTDLQGAFLAAVGNGRIASEGVDYEFDLQGFIREHGLKPLAGNDSEFAPFQLPMETLDGEPVSLDVEVTAAMMCGERLTLIPLAGLTTAEMDVVVSGKQYRLRRPQSFALEAMTLVDETLRKRIRTWELPFVTQPSGISSDGRVIYFAADNSIFGSELKSDIELWPEVVPLQPGAKRQPAELLLAVSRGVYHFAAASEVPALEKSELIGNAPPDPNDSYARYKRFRIGSKTFIVRFEGPCT